MESYGLDAENAEKFIAIENVRKVEAYFGATAGAFAAYKFMPFLREM